MSNRLQYRSQLSRCVEVLIPEERIRRLSVYCYLVLILWPVYLFLLPAVFVYGRWWVLLFMIFPGLYLFTWLRYLMQQSWHRYVPTVNNRFFYKVFALMILTDPQLYSMIHMNIYCITRLPLSIHVLSLG